MIQRIHHRALNVSAHAVGGTTYCRSQANVALILGNMQWAAECLLLPPLNPLLLLIPALYPCLHHLHVSVGKVHQVLDLYNLSIFPKLVEVIVPVKLVPPE